ncbi:Diaminopropionate ammonia-lyase [Thalassovita gelatinovora]|uniref:Diaminopropionate ammonia-lyase n=1 Tax=Thalassovita gelatinovora TaxID=53501 RepID=A0A0N7LVB6_THAGE|nr:pyridoxal-phosphate dependent enzyme [Thalassovita gelatinovora]QIZ80442.1 pyridoxal-phosphate dependent enzyme [Thalassovita gelatinovora]CUH65842.1 Diaminopropionate ammonia-lyase [Thalassovita gelatinovora]SEQ72576.1 diaminopropionate ammonia-lyase [Thalassovita gelatinovora]
MPALLENPFRGSGLQGATRFPMSDATAVGELLSLCPVHGQTALLDQPDLAAQLGIAKLYIKDERDRMGLGSFKALGAAYAIAREAAGVVRNGDWKQALAGRVFVTASAGNHGLSVAAGARVFGARAVIYLAETVPEAFADRLRAKGADVMRAGATYEASMNAAAAAAEDQGWTLLSDSSWPGYEDLPSRVMEGYLQLAAETAAQIDTIPTHIFLQAGVGGLAAAVAAYARAVWGDDPVVIVVEPDAAPALIESIRAGRLITTEGPVSSMGRLDCKTPSMIALAELARDADMFVTISEAEAETAVARLAENGLPTTPSGGAGLAALFAARPPLAPEARVLTILSEGPEDG